MISIADLNKTGTERIMSQWDDFRPSSVRVWWAAHEFTHIRQGCFRCNSARRAGTDCFILSDGLVAGQRMV